jgi:general nucleoside transport system permease protein
VNRGGATAARAAEAAVTALVPVALALVASGALLAVVGRDPFQFYADMFERGLLDWPGFQESVVRMAPLLLIGAGLIVAFRANLWNLGADGQFLLGAAFAAGLSPIFVDSLGSTLTLVVTIAIAAAVGALWTVIPAVLRGWYGVNEIITTLMMSFIGIALANVLVKGPFRTDVGGVARTDTLPLDDRLPLLGDTLINAGIIIAVAAILAVHLVMTRTSFGMRLRVLGQNPRAAEHAGLHTRRLTVLAFMASGALIAVGGAVEILGLWGSFRADFNPAFGLIVIPLVFLARLNALGAAFFIAAFSVIQIGGESAARKADVSSDVLLALVGLILLFMAVTEYMRARRSARPRFLTPGLADRIGAAAPSDETRPAQSGVGTG